MRGKFRAPQARTAPQPAAANAVDFETDDRTVVAGASSMAGLRRGDVLSERYEIRERLRDEAFTLDYRGMDLTSQQRVRVREVRPGLLNDRTAVQELLESLQEVVGVGGAFLPGLLDVGQDGPHTYLVEPWPSGMCLADVFDRRIAQGRNLQPKELLPVVARLDAALAAVPEKWHHGDVRARQVWIDAGNLQLTGPFLLDAMPTGAVAMVLQTNPQLRTYFAPEVAEGWAADPADRYGAATLVWEGLLGEAPPAAGAAGGAVRRLGPLGDVLAQYLSPDPMDRPGTLKPLIEALSKAAGRPAPKLDPAPFRPKRPSSGRRRRHDTIPVPPPSFAEAERAKQAPALGNVPAELAGPPPQADAGDEWDAMPTRQFDRSMAEGLGEPTDPGMRRAPSAPAPTPTVEVDEEPEIEMVEEEGEIELEVDDLEVAQPYGPHGAPKARIPIPEGIKGIPKPRRKADAPATRPSQGRQPAVVVDQGPEPDQPSADASAPAAAETAREAATPAAAPQRARKRPDGASSSSRSVWIVLLAFLAAAVILVGSLFVAQLRREEAEQEKQRRIQERMEQLRREGEEPPPREGEEPVPQQEPAP